MENEMQPRKFFDAEWQKVLSSIDTNKYSAQIDRILPSQRELKVVYKLPLVKNPGRYMESAHIISTIFPPEDEHHGLANHLSHIAAIYDEHEKDQARLLSIGEISQHNED